MVLALVAMTAAASALIPAAAGAADSLRAFPGANGRIAFVSDRDGNREIYTANPDGSGLARLTQDTRADSAPAWAPDGQRIAFARALDIWVMNADGSGARALTGTEGPDAEPAWSPDGTRIVFVSNRNTPDGNTTGPELWIMNADGSGVRQLTDAGALAPAWSPAGDRIAFNSNVDGEFEIYTIAANSTPGAGTDSRFKVTNNVGISDQSPSWSPDGARIVFERGNATFVGDPTKELWVVDADGTDAVRLTTNSSYDVQPSWSPDGTRIAFESTSGAEGDREIFTMPAQPGGAFAPLTATAAGVIDEQPDWGKVPGSVGPPPPPPPPPPPELPAPVPGKTVNVRAAAGQVFIRRPGSSRFVRLTGAASIPIGSRVNVKQGRVSLSSAADLRGAVQAALFYAGVLTVRQQARAQGMTTDVDTRVSARDYRRTCRGGVTRAVAARVFAKRRRKKTVNRLWGNGKGTFRTVGGSSSAAVRGTIWLTEEHCDGTLTRVTQGSVRVRDNRLRRTVTVRAGRSYLARATRAQIRARTGR